LERAAEALATRLDTYEVPYIDPTVEEELRRFVASRKG
jgi:trimethylamine:corrinoid methyltransferase-like protein